ncbi:MAG: hypothetical protein M1609_18040 [Firmicutes bacterium]|nr:hypothetical protein [Bacillota bacterium]
MGTEDYILDGENLTGFCDEGYVDAGHYYEETKDDENDDGLCEEEKKFECPRNFFEAIKRLKNLLVAVEFECAGCCKKAVGILRCVESDFVQLFRPPGNLVQVQLFCPGLCDFPTECACEANIRFEKIISVEQLANQQCP